MTVFLPLVAFFLPLFLLPVSAFVGWPHLVEECLKAGLALVILKFVPRSKQISTALLSGVAFSFSETALYSINLTLMPSPLWLATRLVTTTSLHVLTMLLMTWAARKHLWLTIPALLLSIWLHSLYNSLVVSKLSTLLQYI